MKRLLVLIVLISVAEGANWDGAEWYPVYGASSIIMTHMSGLKCAGDTVYLMVSYNYGDAEFVKWSPNDETMRIDLPMVQTYGGPLNHADSSKRFPAFKRSPYVWRFTEDGWDSTRSPGYTFAFGPDGALHSMTNDTASDGVIYSRRGGGQANMDTVISSCIGRSFIGHWVGVDNQASVTCVVEEDYPSGEDPWIPCIKIVELPAGIETTTGLGGLSRSYLQGTDGRWIVVSDVHDASFLRAQIFDGVHFESSDWILSSGDRFRIAQNPVDSSFEVAGIPFWGGTSGEVYREVRGQEMWEFSHFFETPLFVTAMFYMIDEFGNGNVFVANPDSIYRYGPPPRISDVQSHAPLPQELFLVVYPNPGNAEFRLSYSLARSGDVSLMLFDVTGREVATLADGVRNAGEHVINWSASAQPSGVYFAVLNAEDASTVKKLVLMK